MTYDLRREPWIPWRRRSGTIEWGPPATLLTAIADNPVVAIASPRPDFDGALQELMVGLLTAALQPSDDEAWLELWERPPSAEELQSALDALPNAFDLDGDGPRFFQDRAASDLAEGEVVSIDQLLIDSPGEQGQKLNKDLFVKRGRTRQLGRPAAAMALLTMQTYAPAGGQGHRTSLRGGGPLTTLVDPRVDQGGLAMAHELPLWQKLWANVETLEQLDARTPRDAPRAIAAAFPWLEPTRTSAKGGSGPTNPTHVHPLQAYFGMPRRIRLEFGEEGRCDLTDRDDARAVIGYRTRNYGVQYDAWQHPLSPHYRTKPADPWLPIHGQPGGLTWRDWATLTLGDPAGTARMPATAVAAFARRGSLIRRRSARIHAFGYDMDNMKARGWTEATMPVITVASEDVRRRLAVVARHLTEATSLTGSALLGAVKAALFQRPDDAAGDLTQLRLELWDATEPAFYATIEALAAAPEDAEAAQGLVDEQRRGFLAPLTETATEIFDRWSPLGGLAPEMMRRRVTARHALISTLQGFSKLGESIYTELDLPLPGGGREARRKSAAGTNRKKEKTT